MIQDILFTACTYFALLGWGLMLFFPGKKITNYMVFSGIITLIIAGVYLVVVLSTIGDGNEGSFGSLEGVMILFKDPTAVLAGWIHYLAFDLFIGAWEVSNARKLGLPHGLVIPCLILTCLYGPIGLICYFLVRTVYFKTIRLENFSNV